MGDPNLATWTADYVVLCLFFVSSYVLLAVRIFGSCAEHEELGP